MASPNERTGPGADDTRFASGASPEVEVPQGASQALEIEGHELSDVPVAPGPAPEQPSVNRQKWTSDALFGRTVYLQVNYDSTKDALLVQSEAYSTADIRSGIAFSKHLEGVHLEGDLHRSKHDWPQLPAALSGRYHWIHLPVNDFETVKHIGTSLNEWRTSQIGDIPYLGSTKMPYFDDVYLKRRLSSKDGLFHSRFLKPTCDTDPPKPTPETLTQIFFAMPYIHWEEKSIYKHYRYTIEKIEFGKGLRETDLTLDPGRKLPILKIDDASSSLKKEQDILENLPEEGHCQVRRSLDQSYYSGLEDTFERDNDQVTDRFARELRGSRNKQIWDPEGAPILMVYQLWLWVVDDILVTAFPPKMSSKKDTGEGHNPHDELDVFDKIIKSLDVADTNTYSNATMLACHIIDRCAGNIVDDALTDDSKFQFIDYFDKSIDNLMERQRKLLKQLGSEIKQGTGESPLKETLLNVVDKPDVPKETKQGTRETLMKGTPFNIEDEFDILKEIRDIEEEIHMMIHVVEQQMYAIRLLEQKQRHIAEENPLDAIPFEGKTLGPLSEKSQPVTRNVRRSGEEELRGNHGDILVGLANSLTKIAEAFVIDSPNVPYVHTRNIQETNESNIGSQRGEDFDQDARNSIGGPEPSATGATHRSGGSRKETDDKKPDLKKKLQEARANVANVASRAVQRAEDRLEVLHKMYRKAEHVEQSIRRLLDLKQQQARVLEARITRVIAQEAEKQSRPIMLFTIATIIFLPVSTLAGIFGMNAKDLTGQGNVTLRRELTILFPVSVGCVFLIIFFAFAEHSKQALGLLWEILSLTVEELSPLNQNPLKSVEDFLKKPRDKLMEKKNKRDELREQQAENRKVMETKRKEERDESKKQQTEEKKVREKKSGSNASAFWHHISPLKRRGASQTDPEQAPAPPIQPVPQVPPLQPVPSVQLVPPVPLPLPTVDARSSENNANDGAPTAFRGKDDTSRT